MHTDFNAFRKLAVLTVCLLCAYSDPCGHLYVLPVPRVVGLAQDTCMHAYRCQCFSWAYLWSGL